MSRPGRDRRSSLSVGLQWASAITTIGLEMALPPLFGAWVDRRFGTQPVWTVILAVLGAIVAMRHLADLAKRLGHQGRREREDPPRDSTRESKP